MLIAFLQTWRLQVLIQSDEASIFSLTLYKELQNEAPWE